MENVAPTFTEINGKTTVDEGEAVDYSATATDPGSDDLTYTWNFADGTPELEGANVTHTFTTNGVYDAAVVTVNDDDGAATTSNLSITVNNVAPTLTTDTAKTGNEGEAVSFEATFDDAGNDDLTVTWDFGDGSDAVTTEYSAESTPNSETQSHVYTADGTYTATVTVTDSDGAVTESTVDVTISNTAPVIESLTGDTEINEGDTASFSAIATDPGNDELTYTWDFGDGSDTVTGTDVTHTYTDNGDYTVTLTVTDEEGETAQTLDVSVNNVVPEITNIDGETNVDEGEEVTYSAIASDSGNDELTYTWNFGDDSEVVTGKNVNHTFADNGIYDATLSVEDEDGAKTTQNLSITVNNVAPTIETETAKTGDEGQAVTFNAILNDAGNDELTATWNFGDGSDPITETLENTDEAIASSPTHIYSDDGIYTATLTVTDSDGAVTESNIDVTINNTNPVIESLTGDTEINEGDRVNLNAIALDAGSDELTYTWDLGNGTELTGQTVEAEYLDNGVYDVTLTVSDDDGGVTNSNLTITVNNVAPVIKSLTGGTEIKEGDTATFSAIASDPGDDTLTYIWDFGDDSEQLTVDSSQLPVSHTYADNGDYIVNLTVRDEDGSETSQTLDVSVDNVAPSIETESTKTGAEGSAIEFTAIVADPGADNLTVTWNFGDGSEPLTVTNEQLIDGQTIVNHTYAVDGNYTATVSVADSDEAVTESSIDVTIDNVAPVIESLTGDTEINEGDTAIFNAIATDPGNDELTYTWDFGDGSEQLTVESEDLPVSHTYTDNGDYIATLTVTDSSGTTASNTLDVTVNNTNPVITDITDDLIINEGDTASLNVAAVDAGDDLITYAWDFGDGSETLMGENVEHIFADNGLYEASVTVTDEDGESTTQSLSITVKNVVPIIDPWSDETATEGDTIELVASFSDRGILDTHTIAWDFGDGNTTSDTLTPSHVYADDGIYEVTLTITDNDGASTSSSINVTVNNAAPAIASLTGDTEVNEGAAANFSASATDPGDDELSYTWDFGDGETATGTDVTHTFTQNGVYTVTATVTDDNGASTNSTLEVTVNNIAPVIKSLTGDIEVNEGDVANFSAIAIDSGNDELTYTWDFGDDSEAVTGTDVNHVFIDNGDYTVTLTVTDSDGASTSQTLDVAVNNVAPIVEVGSDKTSDEGSPVQFNATFSDPGITDTHTIAWNFGDGNTVTDTLDPTHVYTDNGEYDVSLTVTDNRGASTTSTLKVRVNNVTPTITSLTGDTQVNEGDVANFSALASDPGADELTYTWDFGDGTTPTNGQNATYQYLQDGTYNTTLTVSDSDGASTSQTTQITVNNLPPTVEAGNNQTVYIGETVNFNGTFSDRGSLDTHTVTWNFGDNTSTSATNNPTHTYTAAGIYNVAYSVKDDFGASSSDTLQLTVKELPTLSVNDINIVEGNDGTANALFTVSLNEVSTRPVTVNYTTANGTATAGADYTATTGTVTFSPGQTSQTVALSITGDRLDEIDENFRLNLTSPVNATIANNQGIGTIIDNDPAPSLTINDSTITEGDNGSNNLTFTVNLSGASGKTVTANYTTADGTATAGVDYTANSGTITFNPGQTSQTIVIPITGDRLDEIDETLTLTLNNPTNATIADGTGVGTILDNDPAPSLSLNDPTITEGDSGTPQDKPVKL